MKKLLSASIAAAALTTGYVAPANADVSANVGFVSDYVFRGYHLSNASTYAGLDYEQSGFYAGTWIIEDDGSSVQGGIETDFYFGYGQELDSGFSYSVGATTYQYSYTTDSETEFGFTLGYAGLGFEMWLGTDEDDAVDNGLAQDAETDYSVIAISYSGDVFGVTVGNYTADADAAGVDDPTYNWAEVSAGGEVAGLDASLTIGTSFGAEGDAISGTASGDGYVILDISKGFSL